MMLRKLSILLALLLVSVTAAPLFAQETDATTSILYLPFIAADGQSATVAADEELPDATVTDALPDAVDDVTAAGHNNERNGAVFVMTNANDELRGNEVVMYSRAADGALTVTGRFPTGGQGLGAGLGSQGALTLSDNGKWLFAVNAGSDEISVFAVYPVGLVLADKVASGGDRPTSVTVRGGMIYVLNAGDPGNITGFRVNRAGKLTPLANSTRNLSNSGSGAAPAPAQVSFTPNGKVLVVTERSSNQIVTYTIDRRGRASEPIVHASSGATPFGFAFGKNDTLVVSEAGGGGLPSAVSSYQVGNNGSLTLISGSVVTGEAAACWIVVTERGKYAYSTNAGTASLSLFEVNSNGALTLLDARGGETGDGTGPTDAGVTRNGRLIYALSPRSQTVVGFSVEADGTLTMIGSFGGLAPNPAGLAAW
ncbi:MAG: beta-propeller fold lactonase family protein [Caldilineaceae bacterium]|nr:beta-propeller fold lactonase family protein [Caldilineaceae bacterium]